MMTLLRSHLIIPASLLFLVPLWRDKSTGLIYMATGISILLSPYSEFKTTLMFLGYDMRVYTLETVLHACLEYEICKRVSAAVMRWRERVHLTGLFLQQLARTDWRASPCQFQTLPATGYQ